MHSPQWSDDVDHFQSVPAPLPFFSLLVSDCSLLDGIFYCFEVGKYVIVNPTWEAREMECSPEHKRVI